MNKCVFICILAFSPIIVYAQNDFLVLKKKDRSVEYFWKDSYISFQLKDRQWVKGIITGIINDSFYLKKEIIQHYFMGPDTIHFSGYHYAINDVYAIPKKGVQIDYINGDFRINPSAGHIHWYWIKSGWIFRVGAAGYATLNIANGLINNNFSLSGSKLGTAAAVFLGGVILHKTYKLTLRMGKKYHLESVKLSK